MANITITRSTENELASIIAAHTDPERAALAVLRYLRAPSERTAKTAKTYDGTLTGALLYEALAVTGGITSSRHYNPVLTGARLTYTDNILRIFTTDGNAEYSASIPCNLSTPFDIFIENGLLTKTASKLKRATLDFIYTAPTADHAPALALVAGDNTILTVNAVLEDNDVPQPTQLNTPTYETTLSFDLLTRFATFASNDGNVLSNVAIGACIDNNTPYLAACDGFRIVVQPIDHKHNKTVLVPSQLINAARFVGDVTISAFDKHVSITGTSKSGIRYTLSTVNDPGNYPAIDKIAQVPYAALEPKCAEDEPYKLTFSIETATLKSALALAKPLVKDDSNAVMIVPDATTMTAVLSGLPTSTVNFANILPLTACDAPANVRIGFNVNLMLDIVNAFDGADELTITADYHTAQLDIFRKVAHNEYHCVKDPFGIVAADRSSNLSFSTVLMPMRIDRD